MSEPQMPAAATWTLTCPGDNSIRGRSTTSTLNGPLSRTACMSTPVGHRRHLHSSPHPLRVLGGAVVVLRGLERLHRAWAQRSRSAKYVRQVSGTQWGERARHVE